MPSDAPFPSLGPGVRTIKPSLPVCSVTSTSHSVLRWGIRGSERCGDMRLRSHSQEAVDPNPGQADSHSTACLPVALHSDFWGVGIGGVLALVSGQPHTRKESVYLSWGGAGRRLARGTRSPIPLCAHQS